MSGKDHRKSMSEKVYEKLKLDILNNKLKPGHKLIEMDISEELKVSRTPIREALKSLEQDGLVTNFPRRGSIVSEVSIEDALELYEVREYLEGLSVKLICMNVTRNEMKVLEDIVEEMETSISVKDHHKLYKLHSKWTETIIELTKNKYLKIQMIGLFENLVRLRRISLHNIKHTTLAYKETKDILEALIVGDELECERLARLHVRNAKQRFIENINENKIKL